MRSQSAEAPTLAEHQETRRRYVALSWQLYVEQRRVNFIVQHPIPEERLRIEVRAFWRGQLRQLTGWTDPLGQVKDWIVDRIKELLSWLWKNLIRPGVELLLAGVKWVLDGVKGVVDTVAKGVGALAGELTKAVGWVWDQMSGLFSALGEVLKKIGLWIINAIKTYVIDPLTALLTPVFEGARLLVQAIFTFLTGGAMAASPIEWRGSTIRWLGIITGAASLVLIPLIGAKLLDLIHPLKDPKTGEIIETAIKFSGVAFLQAAFFTTYFDIACSKPVRQELNALFTPEIPGAGDLITFVVREVLTPEEFADVMKLHGFSKAWSDAYWASHWVLPDLDKCMDMVNRALIPEEEYKQLLVLHDIMPEYVDQVAQLRFVIPPVTDLIRFVVREVIVYAEFEKYALMHALSAEFSKMYWDAHWMLPPTERTRTAFLRKQIPEEEYRKFLVWYDFKPDPRPGISLSDVDLMLKTQYSWPGRIDTRWLIEWGIIDEAAGLELIKAGGMDPTWAPKVLEAYMLNQLREELGKVRTVYERRLREGFMSKEAFAKALHGIHYAVHVINALVRWADEELDLAEKIELAKEYETLAKEQIWTPTEYGAALRKIGMTEERITRKQRHIKTLLAIKAAKEAAKAA